MVLWIRGFLFTMLVPGPVAGYIPYAMMRNPLPDLDMDLFRWAGLFIMCIGVFIY